MSTLGERIKEAADKVGGLNQLAERTAFARRTIGDWVSGSSEPKAGQIAKIALVTGVSVRWLVLEHGPMLDAPTVHDVLAIGAEKDAAAERAFLGPDLEPVEPEHTPSTSAAISATMFREVKRSVKRLNDAAGIHLPDEAIDQEAIKWYNELVAMARGNPDEGKLRLLLPALEYEIGDAIKSAVAEPGTGKHSAS